MKIPSFISTVFAIWLVIGVDVAAVGSSGANLPGQEGDRLRTTYLDYVNRSESLIKAKANLSVVEAESARIGALRDESKVLNSDYSIRKLQRDIDELSAEVRCYRRTLVDLCGAKSVELLDKENGFECPLWFDLPTISKDNLAT